MSQSMPVQVAVAYSNEEKARIRLGATPLLIPQRQTSGSAGLDLYAAEEGRCGPGWRVKVPTGISIAIPAGNSGLVFPRSGRNLATGLRLSNGVGVVDADFRGELSVVLTADEEVTWERGERIAQLVIVPFVAAVLQLQESLDETARGTGGWGSTGQKG